MFETKPYDVKEDSGTFFDVEADSPPRGGGGCFGGCFGSGGGGKRGQGGRNLGHGDAPSGGWEVGADSLPAIEQSNSGDVTPPRSALKGHGVGGGGAKAQTSVRGFGAVTANMEEGDSP